MSWHCPRWSAGHITADQPPATIDCCSSFAPSKITQIYDGTNQIQRMLIARDIRLSYSGDGR